MAVGVRIRKKRRAKGWRQIDLAEHSGVHEVHISDLERGTREAGLRTLDEDSGGAWGDAVGDAERVVISMRLASIYVHRKRLAHSLAPCKRDHVAMGAWMTAHEARVPRKVLIVAAANKLARIVWAVLSSLTFTNSLSDVYHAFSSPGPLRVDR